MIVEKLQVTIVKGKYQAIIYPRMNLFLSTEGGRKIKIMISETNQVLVHVYSYYLIHHLTMTWSISSMSWIGRIKFVPRSMVLQADAGTSCTSLVRYVITLYLEELKAEGWLADFKKIS